MFLTLIPIFRNLELVSLNYRTSLNLIKALNVFLLNIVPKLPNKLELSSHALTKTFFHSRVDIIFNEKQNFIRRLRRIVHQK